MARPCSIDQVSVKFEDEAARARRELADVQRELARTLAVAARVHQSLLPNPIDDPRIRVDVKYLPIDAVGGDYCQVRLPGSDVCYITVCDVCGHGIGPSLLATRVSSEVRHSILDQLSPAEIVRDLNDFVVRELSEADLFVTFFAARIDLKHKTLTYSGAGHPAALHLRPGEGLVAELTSQNLLVGVQLECLGANPEDVQALRSGDRILFYTDGLTEATDSQGRLLGSEGLARVGCEMMDVPIFEMASKILGGVADFRDGPPNDDMTLLVAEIP